MKSKEGTNATHYISSFSKIVNINSLIMVFSVFVAVYHLVGAIIILQSTTAHCVSHISLLLILGLLVKFRDEVKIRKYVAFVSLLVAITVAIYLLFRSGKLIEMGGYISETDMIFGFGLIGAMLVASWLWWGAVIPLLIIVFIIYFIFGHLLHGYLYHPHFDLQFVVSSLGMSLQDGIFGVMLDVSVNMVIYFMIFGAIMEAMGSTPSFIEVGKWISRYLRGGPAYIAYIGSSAVAMLYGGGAGNVAITGTFTIPAMKKSGFSPEDAGAIEAVCSQGSQITPPVMGAAAFVMASFIGVPYVTIMAKAVAGALLYYMSLFISITFLCYSLGLHRHIISFDKKMIFKRLPIFLTGLGVVLALIIRGYSIGMAGSVAVGAVIVVALFLVPESRSIRSVVEGLEKGAIWGAQIGLMLSSMGMVVSTLISTALGPKLTATIMLFTGGLFLPTLLLIAAITVLLSMGMPVAASYTLGALLMAPALRDLNVEMFASHFFVLYCATWSGVTPPVAGAALVASRIAEGEFWRTSLRGIMIIIAPLLLPFIIVVHPELLDFPFSFEWRQLGTFLWIFFAGVMASAFMFKWFIIKLNFLNVVLFGIMFLSTMAFILRIGYVSLIVGILALIAFILINFTKLAAAKL